MNHVHRLLLDCLAHDTPAAATARLQSFTASDWDGVVRAALGYNLAPQLYHRLKPFFDAGPVPPQMRQRLQEAYYLNAGRNMRLYLQLGTLLRCFHDAGAPVILLKGAHLAEIVYGNVALRPMGDIDLLVRHADLLRAHEVLAGQGYANAEKNTGHALGHLPPYVKKHAPAIEIHYNICGPPFSDRFAVGDLWERARPASVQAEAALTLCPEDLVLHLCVHAAVDHGLEMGPLPFFDLARTLAYYRNHISWGSLLGRAEQWSLKRCLLLMLYLSESMAGLVLPQEVRSAGMPDAPSGHELAAARELVFERATPVASDIARLFGGESISAKLGYCLRQIVPSGRIMRIVHPQSRGRLALLIQYCARFRGMLQKQGAIVWRLLMRDKEIVRFAQIENKRNQLKDWITDKGRQGKTQLKKKQKTDSGQNR
ncbi:MAG: nucleotidyltransferase family protein [Deltaproteobacteria bacterium]|nr:nucleotidyltransferase family protein [Deltaproteobacteria bacterium]